MTIVFCKLFFRKKSENYKAKRIRKCIDNFFPDPGVTLAHSVKHYFHLEEYNKTEVEESTSFLLTLRNPVERIISKIGICAFLKAMTLANTNMLPASGTYRFSHPGNCNAENRNEVWRPRGCEAERHRNESGLVQNTLYYKW